MLIMMLSTVDFVGFPWGYFSIIWHVLIHSSRTPILDQKTSSKRERWCLPVPSPPYSSPYPWYLLTFRRWTTGRLDMPLPKSRWAGKRHHIQTTWCALLVTRIRPLHPRCNIALPSRRGGSPPSIIQQWLHERWSRLHLEDLDFSAPTAPHGTFPADNPFLSRRKNVGDPSGSSSCRPYRTRRAFSVSSIARYFQWLRCYCLSWVKSRVLVWPRRCMPSVRCGLWARCLLSFIFNPSNALLFVTRFVLFPSHSPTVLIRSLCGNVLRLAG